jgi:hypothetical protein
VSAEVFISGHGKWDIVDEACIYRMRLQPLGVVQERTWPSWYMRQPGLVPRPVFPIHLRWEGDGAAVLLHAGVRGEVRFSTAQG